MREKLKLVNRILTFRSSSSMAGSGGLSEWSEGASVWFQPPGAAAPLPGELVEVHRAARVLLVSAHLNGQVSDICTVSVDEMVPENWSRCYVLRSISTTSIHTPLFTKKQRFLYQIGLTDSFRTLRI